jgi:uncharacterized protein YndB with AHSA1/START domain
MNAAEGTIGKAGDRQELRFERRLAHPVEDVFDAITKPERVALWIGTVKHDLREGGRYWLRFDKTRNNVVEGTITRYQPPTLFEHTWEDPEDPGATPDVVRWELRPEGDGCVLILTHTTDKPTEAISGWHSLLESLPGALEGRDTPWSQERWAEIHDAYAAKYGGPSAKEMNLTRVEGDPA